MHPIWPPAVIFLDEWITRDHPIWISPNNPAQWASAFGACGAGRQIGPVASNVYRRFRAEVFFPGYLPENLGYLHLSDLGVTLKGRAEPDHPWAA